MTNGEQDEIKMKKIIEMHNKLFSATNRLIEIDKSKFYAWKWHWREGQKVIKQQNIKLDMKSQQLE